MCRPLTPDRDRATGGDDYAPECCGSVPLGINAKLNRHGCSDPDEREWKVVRSKRHPTARAAMFAGAAAAALLAFPGAASAAVTSSVTDGALSVTSDAGDAITITCDGVR